jgi:hypothetical protein
MMSELLATNDLLCAYAVSGQYGYAPRILYYTLVGIVVLIRKQVWLAAGASAYIMTYSGAAAVHAIILCSIHASSTSWLPDGHVWLGNSKTIWIRGLVLDLDTDATLAIVGVGFLMLLPLAVYSTTFQRSKAKPILAAWGVLILIGAICCLVTLFTVNTNSDGSFNQYRICNTNVTDYHSILNTLPLLGDDWNQTINNFFNSQPTTSKSCFYPCLYSSQILHSPSDITITLYPIVQAGSSRYWAFKILEALVYACVPLYIVGGIILLLHKRFWDHSPKDESALLSMRNRFIALASGLMTPKTGLEFVFVCFQAYALVFAPFVMVVFVIFAEFSLSLDPESESIRHVGQWQPLVSVGLVGIAALLSRYSDKIDLLGLWQADEEDPDSPTELFQSMRVGA